MRIPFAVPLQSRDGQKDAWDDSTSKPRDGRIINGYVEINGEKTTVRKRPGLASLGTIRAYAGQLVYNWNGLRAIVGDYMCSGTISSIVSSPTTSNLSPTNAGLLFSAANTGSGVATPRMMFKNRSQAWTMTKAGTVSAVTYGGTMGSETFPVTSITRASTVATVTVAADVPFVVGDSVTIAGANEASYNGAQTVTALTAGVYTPQRDIPITITRSSTTATATSTTAHGLSTGTYTIAGANQSEYNGSKSITVTGTTTFTYTVTTSSSVASPATGTIALQSVKTSLGGLDNTPGSDRAVFRTFSTNDLQNGDTITLIGLEYFGITGPYTVQNRTASYFEFVVTGWSVYFSAGYTIYYYRNTKPTVTSITSSGTTATLTTNRSIGSGSEVVIADAVPDNYNGTFTVTNTGATTCTYTLTLSETPATPATGAITVADPATTSPTTFTYTVGGSPTTPATGTITAQGSGGTVPGIGYLNGYFVVMDTAGTIWNSASDDPTTWGALDFLIAQGDSSKGMGLAVSRNYLVAFKEWSTEYFYDAANATGSPFSPVDSGIIQTGCANGWSIASIDDLTFWLSQTKRKGRGVHLMSGLEVKKVSTPDIDRILDDDDLTNVYGFCLKVEGHSIYILTLAPTVSASDITGITLAYDATSDAWYEWSAAIVGSGESAPSDTIAIVRSGTTATATSNSNTPVNDGSWVIIAGANQTEYNGLKQCNSIDARNFSFTVEGSPTTPATGSITVTYTAARRWPFIGATTFAGSVLLLHESTGKLYALDDALFTDAGNGIDFVVRTPKLDGGSFDRKSLSEISVVGTQVDDRAMVRWSDDDYQSASTYREVDLSLEQPRLRRCGAFRRRSFEMKHVGNSAPILEALELEFGK